RPRRRRRVARPDHPVLTRGGPSVNIRGAHATAGLRRWAAPFVPTGGRMSVTAGRQLGGYQILAPLGAGAMGEVWRARDDKLGREVAIKVLPEHFAHDAERLRRFEREAKTLASLNH